MKKIVLLGLMAVLLIAVGLGVYGKQKAAAARLESLYERAPETSFHGVSDAASPRVAYALRQKDGNLILAVDVAGFAADGKDVSLSVGLAADQTVLLTDKDGKVSHAGNVDRYVFVIPDAKLVSSPAGYAKLKLGLAVEWAGGPFGEPRQRESFLQNPERATHAGLSPNVEDWQGIDLVELAKTDNDARLKIAFDFNQPMEGKATVVIEDEKGQRIRNLISGAPMSAGPHHLYWDGADDAGTLVAPGTYHWRSISHPGLSVSYLYSYCDAPGSNHSTFRAATTNGKDVFFGAPVTEGGTELVQLSPDGTLVHGFNSPSPHGLSEVALAADEKYLYAAYDGTPWGQKVDRDKPDWKADNEVRLFRHDLETGLVVDFSKENRGAVISTYGIGPGSVDKRPDVTALAGLALFNGRLYLADSVNHVVREIDPATGVVARTFPLQNPIALAARADGLYAIAENQLVKLDPMTGARTPIATLEGEPKGLWAASDGRFYVSDGAATAQLVRVYEADGKPAGVIGHAGGVVPGPYDPLKFVHPTGLTVAPDGHLWVTEKDRWVPKRLSAYDVKAGTMWKEFFGPTAYGAPGVGMDPVNPTHWIGQDTMFDIDLAAKTSKPVSILGGDAGNREAALNYHYWRQDGRTFLLSLGKASYVQELLPDGSLKALACLSSAHQFSFSNGWKPPQAFIDAFQKTFPDEKYIPGTVGRPNKGFGFLWVDKNGDGQMQEDEFEFATEAENFAGSGWGHGFFDLTFRVPATVKGKSVLVTMKPDGWWPGGAPKYPAINDAVKAAVPIDLATNRVSTETTVDHFGNMLINSDPVMKAFAPDGHVLWTYPNRWSNVHGSHDAPLPHAGELQGVLFFTGIAPLDDKGDVTVMNGNHGRLFAMTTDGLYIDEMFHDIRLMTNPQAGGIGVLGGECFGGFFGRSDKDGTYYYQGGGIEYRIYRMDGLQKAVRGAGTVVITAEQAQAAERALVRTAATTVEPHLASISYRANPPVIDGKDSDWTDEPTVSWNNNNQFPVSVRAAYDAKMLYLFYTVRDDSPWMNTGKDWQSLFKTGDSVDFQLGTDPKANAARSQPVPGDFRLLIAPFQGANIAVLYRHRLPGATDSVVFQSPWRGEKVDSVKKLDGAQIAVKTDNGTTRVEAAIPLADLGMEHVAGQKLHGDFGVIYGDAEGTTDIFRNYWANPSTGLVNDVPGEIMLTPNLWGEISFGEATP